MIDDWTDTSSSPQHINGDPALDCCRAAKSADVLPTPTHGRRKQGIWENILFRADIM